MKSTELRIGNLVYPFKDTISEIIGITNTHCFLKWGEDTLKATFDQVEPITLTEEWALKLGMSKYSENEVVNQYEVNESCFYIGEDKEIVLKFVKEWYGKNESNPDRYIQLYIYGDNIRPLEYVHHFQNIVHSLTDNELTYTP